MSASHTIPTPSFDDPIVRDVLELEKFRHGPSVSTVHPSLFREVKNVFHLLESLQSARIEGNRTTVEDLAASEAFGTATETEPLREIHNLVDAMQWIEREFEAQSTRVIDEAFLCELHRLTVKNLRTPEQGGDGDTNPGKIRSSQVYITRSTHVPPLPHLVPKFIAEFVSFINCPIDPQWEVLRIAVAHHRFTHIHPFVNGNGRVARLVTYAMLVRARFGSGGIHMLNPSGVFCLDRTRYMQSLNWADSGLECDVLEWCRFMISGMRREFEKTYSLLDASTVVATLFEPVLDDAVAIGRVSAHDGNILRALAGEPLQTASADFFKRWYPGVAPSRVSFHIRRLKEAGLIAPWPTEQSRKYVLQLSGSLTVTAMFRQLQRLGFVEA